MEVWDDIYGKRFNGTWYPRESIVKFSARYLKRRVGIDRYEVREQAKDFEKVLDVGCGNGRHVVFFAEQGFETHGIDISSEAIEVAKGWTARRGLEATLSVGSAEKLPYEDDSFDVVVSDGVIDHMVPDVGLRVMEEIRRVLKPGGYLFVKLRSTLDCEFDGVDEVARNTITLAGGYEKGAVQHFFDETDLREFLEGFEIFDIVQEQERFPSAFTAYKSFRQSSGGEQRFVDLADIDFDLAYVNWHLAARHGVAR